MFLFPTAGAKQNVYDREARVYSATLPCASITLIKFQGVISADYLLKVSTPSVCGHACCISLADYRWLAVGSVSARLVCSANVVQPLLQIYVWACAR